MPSEGVGARIGLFEGCFLSMATENICINSIYLLLSRPWTLWTRTKAHSSFPLLRVPCSRRVASVQTTGDVHRELVLGCS
jgi:hypothetical protein